MLGDGILQDVAHFVASDGNGEVSNPTVTANKKGPASLLSKGKQGLLLYAGVVPQAGQNVRLPGVSYAFGPGFGFSVEPSVTSVIRSGNPPSG